MAAQESAYFVPANFEDTPITVPVEVSSKMQFADGEFSFDCFIWLEDLREMQPIFSKDNYESGSFLSFFVTSRGELAFRYVAGTTISGKYESHRNLILSDSGMVEPGKWAQIALVHEPRKTSFWVNKKPVKAHFSESSEPGRPIMSNEPWLLGGVRMSPDDRPKTLRGRLDDVRFWRGNMTELYRSTPGGRPVPKSYNDWLLADYDMESFNPHLTNQTQIIENRATAEGKFSNGIFQVIKKNEVTEKPIKIVYVEQKGQVFGEKGLNTGKIAGWMAITLIGFYVVALIWWVVRTSPGAIYYVNDPPAWSETSHKYTLPKNVELPVEFGQLWPGERLEFVVQTGSPLPSWRLIMIGGQIGLALLVTREMWVHVFGLLLSENEPDQIRGIFKLIFMVAALLVFLWYFNQKQWDEIVHLFRGKRSVVGTSERLIVGNSDGANRTIFWEQVRTVDHDAESSSVKFELRTGPRPIESFTPEIFWLTNLAEAGNIYHRSKELVANRPVPHTGEGNLNFYPKMTEGGPQGIFGPCELHQTLLFSAHDFFGKNQLLMLRSRIKSAVVEPYEIPKPGWAVVLFLENGARFPLFFTEDLKEAKGATAWFK